jgi:polyhydroxyalkanoate synthesis regulator protein
MQAEPQPTLIKRYAEARLYDATAARYVAVEELRRWQAQGVPFRVIDAKTGEDVARVVLA